MTSLERFLAAKAAWREAQRKLPMCEKAKIIEKLRATAEEFRKIRARRGLK